MKKLFLIFCLCIACLLAAVCIDRFENQDRYYLVTQYSPGGTPIQGWYCHGRPKTNNGVYEFTDSRRHQSMMVPVQDCIVTDVGTELPKAGGGY